MHFGKILVAVLALQSISSFAALPPYWDRVKQFTTIMEAPELEALEAGSIVAVTKMEANVFAVEFSQYRCTYRITLGARSPQPDPNLPPIIGPTQYFIQDISQPTCERP